MNIAARGSEMQPNFTSKGNLTSVGSPNMQPFIKFADKIMKDNQSSTQIKQTPM